MSCLKNIFTSQNLKAGEWLGDYSKPILTFKIYRIRIVLVLFAQLIYIVVKTTIIIAIYFSVTLISRPLTGRWRI